MLSSMFVSFREGLEVVLVVGTILTYLSQTNKRNLSKYVYWGITVGLLVSIVGGVLSFSEAKTLSESGETLFEGIMMLVSSALIVYFIVWMSKQNKNISANIKESINKNSSGIGLFILTFVSVFREAIELIAFILTKVSENSGTVALGTVLGIVIAVAAGYIIFKSSVKLNLKIVFKVLGLILIFLGADLFGEALTKFIPKGGEMLEDLGHAIFVLPSLLYFLKDDIKKFFKKLK